MDIASGPGNSTNVKGSKGTSSMRGRGRGQGSYLRMTASTTAAVNGVTTSTSSFSPIQDYPEVSCGKKCYTLFKHFF